MTAPTDPQRTGLTGSESPRMAPKSITLPAEGGKFAPDGRVLPFAGNTILCHIPAGSDAYAALVRLQQQAKAAPWARNFTFLPPASLHMTVFEGVCMSPPFRSAWPEGIGQDLGRDEISARMLARLDGIDLPRSHRIKAVGIRHNAGLGIHVEGATAEDEASLRQCRAVLSQRLGLVPPGFETYRFHITLGYLLHWVDEDLARRIGEDVLTLLEEFRKDVPSIGLGALEFCDFEDMHAFHPRRLLVS